MTKTTKTMAIRATVHTHTTPRDVTGVFIPRTPAGEMSAWLHENRFRDDEELEHTIARYIENHYPGGLAGWCDDNGYSHDITYR